MSPDSKFSKKRKTSDQPLARFPNVHSSVICHNHRHFLFFFTFKLLIPRIDLEALLSTGHGLDTGMTVRGEMDTGPALAPAQVKVNQLFPWLRRGIPSLRQSQGGLLLRQTLQLVEDSRNCLEIRTKGYYPLFPDSYLFDEEIGSAFFACVFLIIKVTQACLKMCTSPL